MRRLLPIFGCGMLLLAQTAIPLDELQLRSESYFPPSRQLWTTEARSVEVAVVVRDARGQPLAGLTKDSFAIEVGGKRCEITDFSVADRAGPPSDPAPVVLQPGDRSPASNEPLPVLPPASRPRFLALVFDEFSMGPADLVPVRAAARRVLTDGLGKGDRASLFSLRRGQIVPFTTNTSQLSEALEQLQAARSIPDNDCPSISPYEAYRISELHDAEIINPKISEAATCGGCSKIRGGLPGPDCPNAVRSIAARIWEQSREGSYRTLHFLNELTDDMAKLPGQRIVVLATSGFLTNTLELDMEETIDRALRSAVVFNALDAKGVYTQDLHLSGHQPTGNVLALRQKVGTRAEAAGNDAPGLLAEATGGVFFHHNNDMQVGFHELGLAPAVSYLLVFSPPNAPDGKYHPITVRLTSKTHYSVQARPGYVDFMLPPKAPKPELPIDKEVLANDTPSDVPASFSQSPAGAGVGALRVVLHLRVGELPFVVDSGVRRLQVDFIAALFDGHAAFVTGRVGQALFALRDESFRRVHEGLNSGLTLSAPPGKYRLRCVVWESNGGKFTAWNQTVEIQ